MPKISAKLVVKSDVRIDSTSAVRETSFEIDAKKFDQFARRITATTGTTTIATAGTANRISPRGADKLLFTAG